MKERLSSRERELLKEREGDQKESLHEDIIYTLQQKQKCRLDDLYETRKKDLTHLKRKLRKQESTLRSKGAYSKN
jgi:hypothetical protein